VDILVRVAVDGVGLAFALEEHVATQIAKGTLVRVLEDWCPPFPGYFLFTRVAASNRLRSRRSSMRYAFERGLLASTAQSAAAPGCLLPASF